MFGRTIEKKQKFWWDSSFFGCVDDMAVWALEESDQQRLSDEIWLVHAGMPIFPAGRMPHAPCRDGQLIAIAEDDGSRHLVEMSDWEASN